MRDTSAALARLIRPRWPWNRSMAVIGLAYWLGCVLLLLLFGHLTILPSSLDQNSLARLAETRTEFGDAFFRAVSWAGSLYLLLPITAAMIRWLVRHGRAEDAWRLGSGLAGTVAGVYLVKAFSAKPRPNLFPLLIPEPAGFSFPSAHTAQIVAVITAVCFIRPHHGSHCRFLLVAAGILLAGAVGLSRVYLQVHYPSDVVGAAAYAICWVLALESLLRNRKEHTEKSGGT
jgi:membrane-associated phospholipid phosphatase